jgi:hypothetical protein
VNSRRYQRNQKELTFGRKVKEIEKLEKRAEQVLPGKEDSLGRREGAGEGQGEEMAQTMYAHMNKNRIV